MYIVSVKYLSAILGFLLFFTLQYLAGVGTLTAQITQVEGIVTDAKTGLALSYVTVSFKSTQKGTITDTSGYYRLRTEEGYDSLLFSSIGYRPYTHAIKPYEQQRLDVVLTPADYTLSEVVIRPEEKENPAHAIIRAVLKHKALHDRDKLDAFQYEVYSKTEFGMKGVDEKFKKQMLLGAFDFVMDYVDTLNGEDYLPMMIIESLSDMYVRRKPKAKREFIKATQISGVENSSFSQWMGDMNHYTNIYDNQLELLGRQFVSPISDGGFGFYKYTLSDSAWLNSRWCYEIEFRPKRKQEPVFVGNIWIDSATYAVADFDMQIAGDANINYITGIRLKQSFDYINGKTWMMSKEEMYVDGRVPIPHLGRNQPFHGRRMATYRDFVINQAKVDEFYALQLRQVVDPDAANKSPDYWAKKRHETLSKREEAVYAMVDSVKNTPFFRILKTLTIGYVRTGKFEVGPFFSLYSYNPVEGHRFRIGGRTNKYFSHKTQLEAYIAYGTFDQQFKYGATFRQFISKQPRQLLTLNYKHDTEQLGRSTNAVLRQDNVLNSLFSRNPITQLNMVDELKFSYEREWFPGFSHTLQLSHRRLSPLGDLRYQRMTQDGSIADVSQIATTEMGLYLHYGIQEEFLENEFTRVSLGSWYPIFDLLYTKGVSDVLGSDYDYHKLVLGIRQSFRMGILGKLDTRIEGGKVWGSLSYPLLEIHNGNETFFYGEFFFNSMNYFEFASDKYASAAVNWYPQGLILNKIPLLRKLKWREVASTKAIIGQLSPRNAQQLILPENMYSLNKPFVEASLGITNIFTFIRVDALWRLTHLNNPNIVKFGIFVSAEFGL